MKCSGCKSKQEESSERRGSFQKSDQVQYIVSSKQSTSEAKGKGNKCQAEKQQPQNLMYLSCSCCENTFCLDCCHKHMQLEQKERTRDIGNVTKSSLSNSNSTQQVPSANLTRNKIAIICQECEESHSVKYCQNCGQYLCEKCSFKIHNKGKRAKHTLEQNINRYISVNCIAILTKDWVRGVKQNSEESQEFQLAFEAFIKSKLNIHAAFTLFLVEDNALKQLEQITLEKYMFTSYEAEGLKLEDLLAMKSKYPFARNCIIVVFSSQVVFHSSILAQYEKNEPSSFKIEVFEEKKKRNQAKHQRVFSQKISQKVHITHNKNFSNFSNLSAISKVQNQSVISNEQCDLFENNENSSLNVTLNQNSSILMMGALSDYDKQEKEEKKIQMKEQKQSDKIFLGGHNRIYSIREENSNNQANNMSTSTENSIRKRNRKWPIPYFQPLRIPKYERGPKYDAEIYLRQLAEKGILMIRRQKAEEYLLEPQVSRTFVRNIGQRQIEYVAYIIDFLSVQCLTWVIQSVKEDKMTPNQKLIQSRLKESFDLKVNVKLWQSIIKYLQSSQYEQDYFQNTKIRYVPKISVVKYEDEYLLQFQERKWAYEDQELLDQQQEEWKQFKQLITDYFNGKNQITGGRYGCVQYVKLNGPKPLRKCSLGKISMFVQQAINKGIIRYHKTILVSNSQNNNSFCSQQASLDEGSKLMQLQKELKVLAIQLALIDMFLQVPPNTQISLAQIPLNLKKSIIFDYTLVELGFPKLKNILNTLADKLILQSTKTHISYEITTNGSETIEKMRKQAMEQNQYFLGHIVAEIGTITHHYQTLTLQDLYSQLNGRLGFIFEYKLYQLPDFYQFVLYYCANVVSVQFIGGIFVVSTKYLQTYPAYHQTHRSTYSHQSYPNYHNGYHQIPLEQHSKTTAKRPAQVKGSQQLSGIDIEQPQVKGAVATPKFNSSTFIETKKISFGWNQYLEEDDKELKPQQNDQADENHSRQMQHIINILDDGDVSATRPQTVIVKEGPQQQIQFLSKPCQQGDQIDSFGVQKAEWIEVDNMNKANKGQHARFKSTNQASSKHFRQYSTANSRK